MTQTVTVGCKMPAGLILEMGQLGEDNYKRVVIHGTNSLDSRSPAPRMSGMPVLPMVGGFALTPGVPKDFFEAWMKAHDRLDVVRKGWVFAQDKLADAQAHGDLMKDTKTGFEPLIAPAAAATGVIRPNVINAANHNE